ncbi:MAG: acylneuraminate cytidylyltransferase family protein [Sulfurimonas sp.]|nr:acylneuraminate cytidylyltransferase family protein [Sulfurimonas sp.]
MLKGKKILAVIPARGGSKRLKNKNLLPLLHKPLITWTMQAAQESLYIDAIVVSTDSKEIAEEAKRFGLQTPFMRPSELSDDEARSIDVVRHAIQWLKEYEGKSFDYVVLLQPTSPLRNAKHIDSALLQLHNQGADAVVSVCENEHSPLWSNVLPKNQSLENFLKPEYINSRSQDLAQFYRLNGALYICDVSRLLKEDTFFIRDNIYAYIMEQIDSVDIDTKLDFLLAEAILKEKENENAK